MHQINTDGQWLHLFYQGEERDDGCANELSLQPANELSLQPANGEHRLNLLLSNHGFNNEPHDATFSLNQADAQALQKYLSNWLNDQQKSPSSHEADSCDQA
ncbi:hypothetical protein [uncultured Limosilactobacillus sp.]|uniref:hypothetical protein n=1 Tax=uncultured Limosilactobacillus sp. TaxID=2837629 RepID=UPI00259AE206|nr:hypothetical protein [uncultured Limosilactobacillus sp.]